MGVRRGRRCSRVGISDRDKQQEIRLIELRTLHFASPGSWRPASNGLSSGRQSAVLFAVFFVRTVNRARRGDGAALMERRTTQMQPPDRQLIGVLFFLFFYTV